jgi:predicted transcriptional regulator
MIPWLRFPLPDDIVIAQQQSAQYPANRDRRGACSRRAPAGPAKKPAAPAKSGKTSSMAESSANQELLGLTAEIVSAHVSNNPVSISDLPNLIQEVYRTLSTMGQPAAPPAEKQQPAVPIKKSITPEYLICLEDGKKLKMLKRHLKTAFNLTPDQYREKWGLGPDYPMVAPNYTKHRSSLAKRIGLGTKPRNRPPGRGRAAAKEG